jgi:hypothetical protein
LEKRETDETEDNEPAVSPHKMIDVHQTYEGGDTMAKRVLFIHAAGKKSHPLGSGKLIASLKAQLGSDYEVLAPDMPDPDHPGYKAWRDQIEQELVLQL